jgi:acyl-CoA synthetase (NDP forming)
MDELVDMMIAFKHVRRLSGPRAAIIVGGGGRSVLSADDVNAEGLEVPHLPEATQAELREFTPIAGTSIRNPIDANMGATGEQGQKTLRIVAAAPNIDYVLYSGGWGGGPGGPPGAGRPVAPAEANARPDPREAAKRQVDNLAQVQREVAKPVVLVSSVPTNAQAFASYQALNEEATEAGIAVFPGMRRAALALARLLQWQRLQEE